MPAILCAYCRDTMGENPALTGTSHGICAACEAIHFPEPPAAVRVPAEVH